MTKTTTVSLPGIVLARWLFTLCVSVHVANAFQVVQRPWQSTVLEGRTTSTSALHATWSDSRAVKDYWSFLETGKSGPDLQEDGPCVVIRPSQGESPLADAIVKMGMGDDVVLVPGQELPPSLGGSAEYPIYIALPPGQLLEFLQSISPATKERWMDFVFISGGPVYGNIEQILQDTGYYRETITQFLVTGMKFSPILEDISVKLGASSNGEEKWAGECSACGKWCGAVTERLERSNIRCQNVFHRDWRRSMVSSDRLFHCWIVRERERARERERERESVCVCMCVCMHVCAFVEGIWLYRQKRLGTHTARRKQRQDVI